MKNLIIGIVALMALSGCDPQTTSDNLKSCLSSTEQTILLRQVTAATKLKEQFEYCRSIQNESYCRGLYLDANQVVRQCMKDRGYSFIDIDFYRSRKVNPYKIGDWEHGGELRDGMCGWDQYEQPECYQPTLWFQLEHWRWAFREGTG
jgi:hypothetical protein